MPPFIARKRSTPPTTPQSVPSKRARLADALDAEAKDDPLSLEKAETFSLGSDDSSSDSSLSDIDSDQFEDVPTHAKRQTKQLQVTDVEEEDEDDDDGDEIEWEDAAAARSTISVPAHIPMANGPIEITLRNDDDGIIDYGSAAKAGSGKKGPSKREKAVRVLTHKLHVQFLLWHNAVRNFWIGDTQLQEILVKQLPQQIIKEIERWKRASGLLAFASTDRTPKRGKWRRKTKKDDGRSQRDWGNPSQRLEAGKADMSHGDPLIHLMKILAAYWKKRFAITNPGLRKRGYGTKQGLRQEITSFRNEEQDAEKFGEKIEDLEALRNIARTCEGSRDVGAQLFTALLRGLGIEARLVASLQPTGYGWTKAEQLLPRKHGQAEFKPDKSESDTSKETLAPTRKTKLSTSSKVGLVEPRKLPSKRKEVIALDSADEEDGGASSAGTEDDDSVVDITPSTLQERRPRYDRDLVFPIYWTEAISPITSKIIPISPLVLQTPVASNPEILSLFEPRGIKAEKGKQVMAYVVAYSPDGSAKDVTVRYLRKNVWPGKTKGFRIPVEKVPVCDKNGRIKRYENYDWFKATLSPYTRSDSVRTAVDDVEDTTDLVPQQPEQKNEQEGVDTLQSLKSSADFVLERFLRREEALRPGAKIARTFISGKGDKYKEEPVYRRSDVERCLTAESWHKEGRRPKLGETPMKMVPVRAVTLTRKREAEEHERQYGEKQMQGLYSWDQSEWIIPPPIQDGVIPKNAYGNMDCFVPSMVPKGAVHIPLKGTVRICKKLDIDFAEAVTGFEFGNKRAVPVCTGVVVAKENERLVKDAWHEWNEEQRRKEDTKMEKLVLDLWRKFVLGLRIRERVHDMYGDEIGVIEGAATGSTREDAIPLDEEDDEPNGSSKFNGESEFVDDNEGEEMGGGFLLAHEEEIVPMEDLILEDQSSQPNLAQNKDKHVNDEYPTPLSINGIAAGTLTHNLPNQAGSVFSDPHHDLDRQPESDESLSACSSEEHTGEPLLPELTRSEKLWNQRRVRRTDLTTSKRLAPQDSQDETTASSGSSVDSEDEPPYVPNSSSTRNAKRSSHATKQLNPRKNKQQQKREEPRSAPKNGSASMVEDNRGVNTNLRAIGRRKSQRQSRKSNVAENSPATPRSTPKRSARLLRRESTIVTSPYFE